MTEWTEPSFWLPLVFLLLMGAAMLAYVLLDGYDLGVGILLRRASETDKDRMISSIGPFWDANETWLVLGVGILLTAFPIAHGAILGALYLPVALMLAGLILRGVAFDFRVKAHAHHKPWWDRAFYLGSVIATFAQGTMLGSMVTGFTHGLAETVFSLFIAIEVMLRRMPERLRGQSHRQASTGAETIGGVAHAGDPGRDWLPYIASAGLFFLAFLGLAYSLFPFLVVDRLTIWQAASAPESLLVIFYGACVVLPAIVGYTIYAYRVFGGKATDLSYD